MITIQKVVFFTLSLLVVQQSHGALLRLAVRSAAVAQNGLGLRGAARACATGALSAEQRKLVEARIAWLKNEIAHIPESKCTPYLSLLGAQWSQVHAEVNRARRAYTQELLQWELRLLQK